MAAKQSKLSQLMTLMNGMKGQLWSDLRTLDLRDRVSQLNRDKIVIPTEVRNQIWQGISLRANYLEQDRSAINHDLYARNLQSLREELDFNRFGVAREVSAEKPETHFSKCSSDEILRSIRSKANEKVDWAWPTNDLRVYLEELTRRKVYVGQDLADRIAKHLENRRIYLLAKMANQTGWKPSLTNLEQAERALRDNKQQVTPIIEKPPTESELDQAIQYLKVKIEQEDRWVQVDLLTLGKKMQIINRAHHLLPWTTIQKVNKRLNERADFLNAERAGSKNLPIWLRTNRALSQLVEENLSMGKESNYCNVCCGSGWYGDRVLDPPIGKRHLHCRCGTACNVCRAGDKFVYDSGATAVVYTVGYSGPGVYTNMTYSNADTITVSVGDPREKETQSRNQRGENQSMFTIRTQRVLGGYVGQVVTDGAVNGTNFSLNHREVIVWQSQPCVNEVDDNGKLVRSAEQVAAELANEKHTQVMASLFGDAYNLPSSVKPGTQKLQNKDKSSK